MRLFGEDDSPVQKGVVILGGLGAAGAVFVLALFMLFDEPVLRRDRAREAPEEKPARAASSRKLPPGWSEPAPPPSPTATASSVPPVVRDDPKLARAMDQSNVRQLVRTLALAAATENQPLKTSMLGAIARSPAGAREVVQSELAQAQNPAVRQALEEALARSR
jgi:hypothetical protein